MAVNNTQAQKASRRRGDYESSLGLTTDDPIRLVKMVRQGLSFSRLARFQRATELSWERIATVIRVPSRTITRRKLQGQLRADESDRLLRIASLFDSVVRLFDGDLSAARAWLQSPQVGLGGEAPIDFASTQVGAREVENLILRLENGVFT